MEFKRRTRRNKLNLDIRNAETLIKRSKETIKRLRSSQMGEEYVKSQIQRLKTSITEKEDSIDHNNAQLKLLNKGLLDEQLEIDYKTSINKVNKKVNETKQLKEHKRILKQKNKVVSKNYWNSIISESRKNRQTERDSRYALKHFNRAADSLPAYMKRNLSKMPHNKGYIWKDVHFYGELPDIPRQPQLMFEKTRGNILIIHENTEHEYRRYEKTGKERKRLVFQEARRKVRGSACNLMDYMKNK